jgi:Methyltransferase domain
LRTGIDPWDNSYRLEKDALAGGSMLDLESYLRRPISTLKLIASDPLASWMRFQDRHAAHSEGLTSPDLYKADGAWESRLHRLLDLSSPAAVTSEFEALWPKVIDELEEKGIRAGPQSFACWNDGDAGFVRAIWCLVRHLQPRDVIETGVAHGVTSRFILEALERNGSGHLWSIDLPPMEPEWKAQVGMAVDGRLHPRWTYLLGSSRQLLPGLISRLGEIDIFVHDSLHTGRNVRFEMDRAWAVLRPGGAIVVDDIDANPGFHSFTGTYSGYQSIVCEAEPLRPDLRRFNKKGLFGIILKNPITRNVH